MSEFSHQMGRRGRNHHDDDDYNKDLDLSKLSFYDEDNNNDDEEEEEPADEDEIYNRGRSRSRSIHELDSAPLSADAVIAQHNIVDPPSSSEVSKLKPPEKSGPLNNKEILALKKGLEEASMQAKQATNEEEEEEERIAAENERKLRITASTHNTANSNNDATAKRAKILMLGDSGVGKSSLIMRWTLDTFTPSLTSTVGVNFKSKKVTVKGEAVQVQVWDTAGQEQFHKITTSYYKGAQGIMLVYDVTDQKSFDNVTYWIKNIKAHASDTVQVALIGNKTDLRSASPSSISSEKGKEIAASFGVPFFETSAKDSTNVNDGFVTLVGHIVDVMNGGGSKRSVSATSTGSSGSSGSPTTGSANAGTSGGVPPPLTATAAASGSGGGANSNASASNGERRSIVEKQEKTKMFGLGGKKKDKTGGSDKDGANGKGGSSSPGGEGGDKKDCIIS